MLNFSKTFDKVVYTVVQVGPLWSKRKLVKLAKVILSERLQKVVVDGVKWSPSAVASGVQTWPSTVLSLHKRHCFKCIK